MTDLGTIKQRMAALPEQWRMRASSLMGRRPARVGPAVFVGVAGILIGAAAMYLLDPVAGRRRRHFLRDKTASAGRHAGQRTTRFVTNLRNRLRGMWHETQGRLSREQIADDRTLCERIRSAIGHVSQHASSVRVSARNGVITLSGAVPEREAGDILSAAHGVRGVHEIVDHLEGTKQASSQVSWRGL